MEQDANLKISIDNSIRSIFQIIAVIDDATGNCRIIDHNRELDNITADPENEAQTSSFKRLRRSLKKNVHPEDRDAFLLFTDHDHYVKKLKGNVHMSMECRIRHSDSRYYWSEIMICNTTEVDSTKGNDCILLIRDIDERKNSELKREAEERAVFESLKDRYDSLFEENMTDEQTGCYNRKGLRYYTDVIIEDAKENKRDLFVCVADLNGLKHINDTYGHAAGDEAIRVVSKELKNAAPAGCKAVRIGGDEFLLFASVDKGNTEPDEFGIKLDKGIEAYNAAHSNPYSVGASYGWVLLPPGADMTSLDEYIEKADKKMYEMRVLRDEYRRD